MIRLIVARGSMPTGKILESLLLEKGVPVNGANPTALVSYGVRLGTSALPQLNSNAGMRNKMQELEVLRKAGVKVPETWLTSAPPTQPPFPLLARRFQHKCGYDIRVVRDWVGLRRWQGQRDYFVRFVESTREFRVWVYRDRHLGTYEKILVRPEEQKGRISRNHRNGYAFQLISSDAVPREAVTAAMKSIRALDLDFAAVDVLLGKDGGCWVLEANTAPGVEGPGRQAIQGLAGAIARWVEKGYPQRKGASDVLG